MIAKSTLPPKQRYVANWLKRRGYTLMSRRPDGFVEWWAEPAPDFSAYGYNSKVVVTVDGDSSQYSATFRPSNDIDVHVTIYLRDLGKKNVQLRLREFEDMARACRMNLPRKEPPYDRKPFP